MVGGLFELERCSPNEKRQHIGGTEGHVEMETNNAIPLWLKITLRQDNRSEKYSPDESVEDVDLMQWARWSMEKNIVRQNHVQVFMLQF